MGAAGRLATRGLDLANGILDRIEDEERRGVAGLVVLDRLKRGEIGPATSGRPPSFNIFRIAAPTARSSAAVEPTISRPMIADEDWPKREASAPRP